MLSKILSLCLLLTPFALHAQPQGKINIRFAYLNKHQTTPEKLALLDQKKLIDLEISNRTPADYVEITTPVVLIGQRNNDPKILITPCAQGIIPNGVNKVTALLNPKKDGSSYDLIFLDEKEFSPGAIYFINETEAPVMITLNDDKLVSKPKTNMLHKPKVSTEASLAQIHFQTHIITKDGKPKLHTITESKWQISGESAEICIFYKNNYDNQTALRGMTVYYPSNR
jgi:hypothetical protein